MRDRAQDIFVDVLLGELGICSAVEEVREVPVLQPAFEGKILGYSFDRRLLWWFVETFVEDRQQLARLHRMEREVRRVFLDLAKLHAAATGQPTLFPERLVQCLQRRVVGAALPTAYEIATGARKHPVARVSANLQRRSPEESWRTAS